MEEFIKQHMDKFVNEQESLIAKFINEKQCEPSDVVLVSEHRGFSLVVYPMLKKDLDLKAIEPEE